VLVAARYAGHEGTGKWYCRT